MIVHEVAQGSPEWLALRVGIPTASCFGKIVTPLGKPSKTAETYLHTLLAERLMGRPVVEFVNSWMERGTTLEPEAAQLYERLTKTHTVRVGFITDDEGRIGASPDRLVGDDGLLEIKCPKESTHVGYLISKTVDDDYRPQVQGQLWITGRKWADTLSYHPELPPVLMRVERDEDYIAKLSAAVRTFSDWLETKHQELKALRPNDDAPEDGLRRALLANNWPTNELKALR